MCNRNYPFLPWGGCWILCFHYQFYISVSPTLHCKGLCFIPIRKGSMILWKLKLKIYYVFRSNIAIFANVRNSMSTCNSFYGIIVFSLGTIAYNLINFGLLWLDMSSLALLTVLKNKLLPYILFTFSFAYHRKNSYKNVIGLQLNLISTFVSFKGCL